MKAGALRQKAQIKRLVESRDDFGGVSESWELVGSAWCGFVGLRGSERETEVGDQSKMVGTIFFRYSSLTKTIALGDRIIVQGVTYSAISPAVNESLKNDSITVAVSMEV